MKNILKSLMLIASACLALCVTACSANKVPVADQETTSKVVAVTEKPVIEDIRVQDMIINTLDKDVDIVCEVLPAGVAVNNVTFSVVDETVACVVDGKISAVQAGETELLVAVDGIEKRVRIVVQQAPIELIAEEVVVCENESAQIDVQFGVDDVEVGTELNYKSKDETVATVSSDGIVSGRKSGVTSVEINNELGQTCETAVTVVAKEPVIQSNDNSAPDVATAPPAAVEAPVLEEPVVTPPAPSPEPQPTCPKCGEADHTVHPEEPVPPSYSDNEETIDNQTQPGFGDDHEIGEDY